MWLNRQVKEFCRNTYTHGFIFIVLPKRHVLERMLWFAVTAVSISASVTLSWQAWVNVRDAPTLTLTDSPNYPIWNYLFPAVTVCNFNVISKKRAYEIAKNLKRPEELTVEEVAWQLRLLYHLIDVSIPDIPQEAITTLQNILDTNNILIEELLQKLAPSCNEMLQRCSWKGQQIPCNKLFEQIKTPDGFCCSFNYFGLKNHTFGGTVNNTSANYKVATKPRKVAATGYHTALETVINSIPEDYFATPFSSFGHRVIIHYPYNYPSGSALSMVQSTQGIIFIGVKPSLYRTDGRVNSLPVTQRKCLFRYERQLNNFEYTYYNCVSECRANITKQLCHCIPFYYFYGANNDGSHGSTRVCNLQDIHCLFKNREKIQTSLVGFTTDADQSYTLKRNLSVVKEICSCLPDCHYSYYSIEGSAGEFNKEYVANKPLLFGGVKLVNQSVFRVFFDDLVSTRYTTSVKYYWHTILGLFGGVLGLFTGISIVSLIEMTYFFTIRPILNLLVQMKARKNTTNGNKILINKK